MFSDSNYKNSIIKSKLSQNNISKRNDLKYSSVELSHSQKSPRLSPLRSASPNFKSTPSKVTIKTSDPKRQSHSPINKRQSHSPMTR